MPSPTGTKGGKILYGAIDSPARKQRRMKVSRRRLAGRNGGGNSNSISMSKFSSLPTGVSDARYVQTQTALAPFPLRWNTRLTYGVNAAISTVGSVPTASKYRFRLNSGYDPDVTGTGEQPYQWDQMIAMYTKYIVKRCRAVITFNDPTSSGMFVGWSYHTDTTNNDDPAGKTLGDIMSRPTFQCVPLTNYGSESVTMSVDVPVHEVFGLSQQQYLSVTDQYGAAFNANPLSVAYLDLFLIDPNSLVSPQYVRAVGRLIYDIQFFDYAAPSGS